MYLFLFLFCSIGHFGLYIGTLVPIVNIVLCFKFSLILAIDSSWLYFSDLTQHLHLYPILFCASFPKSKERSLVGCGGHSLLSTKGTGGPPLFQLAGTWQKCIQGKWYFPKWSCAGIIALSLRIIMYPIKGWKFVHTIAVTLSFAGFVFNFYFLGGGGGG